MSNSSTKDGPALSAEEWKKRESKSNAAFKRATHLQEQLRKRMEHNWFETANAAKWVECALSMEKEGGFDLAPLYGLVARCMDGGKDVHRAQIKYFIKNTTGATSAYYRRVLSYCDGDPDLPQKIFVSWFRKFAVGGERSPFDAFARAVLPLIPLADALCDSPGAIEEADRTCLLGIHFALCNLLYLRALLSRP